MTKCIAWIEDDIDVMVSLKQDLSDHNFEIHEYRTYTEALDGINEIAKADILLIDAILPPGIKGPIGDDESPRRYLGLDFLRLFRNRFGERAPAVILSVVALLNEVVRHEELRALNAIALPKMTPLRDIRAQIIAVTTKPEL